LIIAVHASDALHAMSIAGHVSSALHDMIRRRDVELMQISPLYGSIFVASMLFPALATIFKEKMFTDAKQKLGGKQLDIFVVSSYSSSSSSVSASTDTLNEFPS
jgi:hypothetical protein